jgi:uncharacterized protein (TIGR02285 family)
MKLLPLFLFLLLISAESLGKEELLWYHPNFPPANFVEGLMEGLGHNDLAEKFISSQMLQYQHDYITASYQRIMHSLKFGHGCAIGFYKNAKIESKVIFSVPYLLTFPNGLIIRKNQLNEFVQYFDNSGSISIKALLDNEKLLAGIADGRKYQGIIDIELAQHRDNDNIIVRSNTDVFSGLLQMLDKKRIDYLFGFPEELEYHTSLGVLENEMQFIPISEMPKFLISYIICSKSPLGEKAIHEINKVLLSNRTKPQFLRFYQFWLDFESKKRHKSFSQSELAPPLNNQIN